MKFLVHHAKRHYHEKYRERYRDRAHWVFLFDQFLVGMMLTLLSIGTYYAFFYAPLRDSFRFSADIPENLAAGEEADVALTVSNVGQERFHNVVFSAYLPDNFILSKYPEGYDPETESTPVGVIEPGESLTFSMRGQVIGPPSEVTVYVRMTASNDQGEFDERIFPVRVAWNENHVYGEFSLPGSIIGNQTFPMTLTFRNGSRLALDDVRVRPRFPDDYRLLLATPPIVDGEAFVGPVEPGESVELRLSGRTPPSLDAFEAAADIVWVIGDTEILLDRVTLEHQAVTTNLEIKAAFDAEGPVHPGDEVPFSLTYANNGAFTLTDVSFAVAADTLLTDAKDGRLTLDGGAKTLKPGDRGTLNGTIRIKSPLSQFVFEPELALAPEARVTISEAGIIGAVLTGTPSATMKIAGTVTLESVARYFTSQGEQLGRGILPPKAGKETRYWIFVSASAGTSDLTDVLVETTLPPNVRWTGRQAVTVGDELVERESGSVVVWRVGDIHAHAGVLEPPATASFEVALTPTEDQIGSTAFLTIKTELDARGRWTDQDLHALSHGETTELKTDPRIDGRIFVSP